MTHHLAIGIVNSERAAVDAVLGLARCEIKANQWCTMLPGTRELMWAAVGGTEDEEDLDGEEAEIAALSLAR